MGRDEFYHYWQQKPELMVNLPFGFNQIWPDIVTIDEFLWTNKYMPPKAARRVE